jgi:hypothetical protein
MKKTTNSKNIPAQECRSFCCHDSSASVLRAQVQFWPTSLIGISASFSVRFFAEASCVITVGRFRVEPGIPSGPAFTGAIHNNVLTIGKKKSGRIFLF